MKLYLLTDAFPYGKGEKTFLSAELEKLVEAYSVTIISNAGRTEMMQEEYITKLDPRIRLFVHEDKNPGIVSALRYSMAMLFDGGFWREVREIVKEGDRIAARIVNSVYFYMKARDFYLFLCRNQVIDRTEPGLCYSYWSRYYCFGISHNRKRFPGLKMITRVHGFDLYNERERARRQPFKKLMDKELDAVVFAAEYAKQYYLEHFARDTGSPSRYIVSRIGTKKQEMHHAAEGDTLHLVSCSNMVPLKRIHLIIDGLSRIAGFPVNWVHFGSGELSGKLQKYADEKLSLNPWIVYRFAGQVTSDELMGYYKKNTVSCFITTTSSEGGCPVSIQEAMAFGIPVIASAVGGIPEMMDGNGILLSEKPDGGEVKAAVERIHKMTVPQREALRIQSRKKWETDFDEEKNTAWFLEELKRITER